MPPPSAAFPYQDLAHFSSLALGGFATYATWEEVRATTTVLDLRFMVVAIALMLVAFVIQAVLGLSGR